MYYILLFLLFGCGEEGNDVKDTDSKAEDLTKPRSKLKITSMTLVSKDRKIEKILSDFAKPLNSYPTIFQDNTTIRKMEGCTENLLDEPFTGTVVKIFGWNIILCRLLIIEVCHTDNKLGITQMVKGHYCKF